jgi:hypothetical protein
MYVSALRIIINTRPSEFFQCRKKQYSSWFSLFSHFTLDRSWAQVYDPTKDKTWQVAKKQATSQKPRRDKFSIFINSISPWFDGAAFLNWHKPSVNDWTKWYNHHSPGTATHSNRQYLSAVTMGPFTPHLRNGLYDIRPFSSRAKKITFL